MRQAASGQILQRNSQTVNSLRFPWLSRYFASSLKGMDQSSTAVDVELGFTLPSTSFRCSRAMSRSVLSMLSRVELTRLSTSAGVIPVVLIGGRTDSS